MIPVHLSPLANHLWQSTLFAGVAAILALVLRKNRAQTRYLLWLSASVKFLVPFSLLVGVGSQFEWRSAAAVAPTLPLARAMEQISQPFTPLRHAVITPSRVPLAPKVLGVLWFCGFAGVLFVWCVRWQRIRAALRVGSPLPLEAPIRVISSPTLIGTRFVRYFSSRIALAGWHRGPFDASAIPGDSRTRVVSPSPSRQPCRSHSHGGRSDFLVSSSGVVDRSATDRRARASL